MKLNWDLSARPFFKTKDLLLVEAEVIMGIMSGEALKEGASVMTRL